jgi:hypothetical protein
MFHSSRTLKAIAVFSFVVLISGYVAFRSGALSWLVGQIEREYPQLLPGSKATFETIPGRLGGQTETATKQKAAETEKAPTLVAPDQ